MIISYLSKETEKIFNGEVSRDYPGDIQRTALRKLLMIDAATSINDLRSPPGNRLEQLSGDRSGQYIAILFDLLRKMILVNLGEIKF